MDYYYATILIIAVVLFPVLCVSSVRQQRTFQTVCILICWLAGTTCAFLLVEYLDYWGYWLLLVGVAYFPLVALTVLLYAVGKILRRLPSDEDQQ